MLIAVYKTVADSTKELLLSILHNQTSHQTAIKMTSPCTISFIPPPNPLKFVQYDPRTPKPTSKPKVNSIPITNTAEHSCPEVDLSKENKTSFDMDDIPRPDPNALFSLEARIPP